MNRASAPAIVSPGRNAWRVERAARAALIVDAADYYIHVREAMLGAQRQILLIGWDFDTRIDLAGDREAGGDAPTELGPFLSWLARNRPALDIHILKWDFGAVKLLGRGTTILRLFRWWASRRIHFRLDGAHPSGASHHQKIAVVDDRIAFCGGIDMTASRWDTRAHKDGDPRRKRPTTRRRYGPWHDATMAVDGAAARALGELGRARWLAASGEVLPEPKGRAAVWPKALKPHFREVDVAIARTCGETGDQEEVREIEGLVLDMIKSARRFVYAENQYFASYRVAEAIAARLKAKDGPEFVLVNPKSAEGWLEEELMGSTRAELVRRLQAADRHGRFRIYTPVTAGGEDIYVHAKIMIVDDRILRVGSANLNNRSMGFDSECDLAIDAGLAANRGAGPAIASVRADLMTEHLGVEPREVEAVLAETGSLIAAVERLRGSGRTLVPFEPPEINQAERALARSDLLDPETANEPIAGLKFPSLFSSSRRRPGSRAGDARET